jgi:hypothetical protein
MPTHFILNTQKNNTSRKRLPNMQTPIVSTANRGRYYTWPDPENLTLDSRPRSELSMLLASSFPLVCTSILQYSQVAVTLLFVGRLGKDELAAVSLACLTANVTGWAVFQGLASALDTLCPQAYGAGLKRAVGLHTQRMGLLLLCISIPIGIFWQVTSAEPKSLFELFCEAFLLFRHVPEEKHSQNIASAPVFTLHPAMLTQRLLGIIHTAFYGSSYTMTTFASWQETSYKS